MCFVERADSLRCRPTHDLAILLGKVSLCLRREVHIALLAEPRMSRLHPFSNTNFASSFDTMWEPL